MKFFKETEAQVEHEHEGRKYKATFKPITKLDYYDLQSDLPSELVRRVFQKLKTLEVKEGNKTLTGEQDLPFAVIDAIATKYIEVVQSAMEAEAEEKNSPTETSN